MFQVAFLNQNQVTGVLLTAESIFDFIFTNIDFDNSVNAFQAKNSMHMIGILLYQQYFVTFIVSSIILLLAMVGAIVVTLKRMFKNHSQLVFQQLLQASKLKSFKHYEKNLL